MYIDGDLKIKYRIVFSMSLASIKLESKCDFPREIHFGRSTPQFWLPFCLDFDASESQKSVLEHLQGGQRAICDDKKRSQNSGYWQECAMTALGQPPPLRRRRGTHFPPNSRKGGPSYRLLWQCRHLANFAQGPWPEPWPCNLEPRI